MMGNHDLEMFLLRASDDPHQFSDEIQAELSGIHDSLRKRGVSVSSVAAHPAGDTDIGQFLITLGPPAIAAIAAVAGAWVQARFGRKVRLKFGDIEAEARTPGEIEELLNRVSAFRDSTRDAGEDR
jgi:hypothetical protein